jgi:hypothetical protein
MDKMNNSKGKMGLCAALIILFASAACAQSVTETKLSLDYALSQIPTNLQPGDSGVMTLIIKNVGSRNAEGVEIFIPDMGDIRVSKREYIGTMLPGQVAGISTKYTISGDAEIGLHTIQVTAYYNGYNVRGAAEYGKSETWEINVNVKGESIFVVEGMDTGGVPKPGDTIDLKVRIKNMGVAAAYDAEGQLATGNPLIKVIGSEKQFLGDIAPAGVKELQYTVYLDKNLPTGAYSLPLAISYKDKNHNAASATLPLGLQVAGETRVSITVSETDPKEIHAGDTDVLMKIKLDNQGTTDIKTVRVVYVPQAPFENSRSYVQSQDLGTVRSGASSVLSFYANVNEDALPSRTEQLFQLTYEIDNVNKNVSIRVLIDVMDYPDFNLSSEDTIAKAGASSELRVKVENKGSKCDSVTVWALKKSEQPFEFSDKSEYIGDLGKGESGEAVIRFTVDEGAKVKEYILPMEIRCTKDDVVLVFSKTARINVEPGAGGNNMSYVLVGAAALVIFLGAYNLTRNKKKNKNADE